MMELVRLGYGLSFGAENAAVGIELFENCVTSLEMAFGGFEKDLRAMFPAQFDGRIDYGGGCPFVHFHVISLFHVLEGTKKSFPGNNGRGCNSQV